MRLCEHCGNPIDNHKPFCLYWQKKGKSLLTNDDAARQCSLFEQGQCPVEHMPDLISVKDSEIDLLRGEMKRMQNNYLESVHDNGARHDEEIGTMKNCVNCGHGKHRPHGDTLISYGCEAPFGTQENFTGGCCDGWKKPEQGAGFKPNLSGKNGASDGVPYGETVHLTTAEGGE